MKIFVTGATGFIGKNLVNHLSVDNQVTINLFGNEISPFDTCVETHQLNESSPSNDIEFLKNEKFDGIIHLASLYLTSHTSDQITNLIDSNVKFSTYILECAAQASVNWFINTGTFWQHFGNKDYSPVNLYAASKQAFESIAQYYWETNQIRYCTLKLSDTFGPNDPRPKIFNLWQRNAIDGKVLEMSPGEQLIDISYIDDIVLAFSLLAKHLDCDHPEMESGNVFAVKAEKRYTLRQLAELFEKVTNKKLNINWGGRTYRQREVMVPWEHGRIVPGWKQQSSLELSIKKTFCK